MSVFLVETQDFASPVNHIPRRKILRLYEYLVLKFVRKDLLGVKFNMFRTVMIENLKLRSRYTLGKNYLITVTDPKIGCDTFFPLHIFFTLILYT